MSQQKARTAEAAGAHGRGRRVKVVSNRYGRGLNIECCRGTSARGIVGPDSSPSKNPERFAAEYSTGGEIWWDESHEVMPLGMLPNCCGVTVAEVEANRPFEYYSRRLVDLSRSQLEIGDIRVQVDLNRKNHFLGLFQDEAGGAMMAVIHCSAPEFREQSPHGFGLSHMESAALKSLALRLDTPAGPILVLANPDAIQRFSSLTEYAARFAERKREVILREMFGDDIRILSSRQHQGYVTKCHVVLGSQLRDSRTEEYIYLLGPDRAAFMVVPADRLKAGDLDVRGGAAGIPHGGGYELTNVETVKVDFDQAMGFRFALTTSSGHQMFLGSLGDMPFGYRGEENVEHAERMGICSVSRRLRPLATLRN